MQDDRRGDSSRKQLRLPTIAPRDDQASSTSSSRSGRINNPVVSPRTRLPPRSRTGCWTCRTRKVKCDEGRPVCGQCARLGHTCDYSPKLTFRDDTNRVVERMQDVTVAGSAVWDRTDSPTPSSVGSAVDDLPPFASLLTDEERERKAGASNPGTYNVVVSPESFQHLPEYSDAFSSTRESISPLRRGSIASSVGRDSPIEALPLAGDPNVVILPRFEDLSRRSTRELRSPTSPISIGRPMFKREQGGRSPINASDKQLLQHFRDVVWKRLVPPEHDTESSVSLLDEVGASFPPVIRAMVAVASLSLSQQDGNRLNSLHHYSQTLPELQSMLKSEEDLASDGAFLTHFLMLIYEISAADPEHTNLWSHHIQTLLRITLLRRRFFGGERFPFIVWWICNIDLDALLSGIGPGGYVGHMLKNDLIPPPSFHLYPLGVDGSSVVYPEETDTLPTVLQLDYEVMLHTVQLGMLAHEFRTDQSFYNANIQQRAINVKMRQRRVYEIQENLRHLWNVPAIHDLAAAQLSDRTLRLFQRAWTLYRACIIFSHTSMWEGQRLDTSPNFDAEIATAAMQILQVAETAVFQDRFSCRFLVFPLFLAGFASADGSQKLNALSLIEKTEKESLSRNTIIARNALQAVYNEQHQQFLNTGHSLDVGWFQVMQSQKLTVVTFGM